MKNLNTILFLCISLFMTNCCNGPACGGDTYLSPLVKYKDFPMKKSEQASKVGRDLDFLITDAYTTIFYEVSTTYYYSRFGIISNIYYPYMDNKTHIVYWVSNQITNRFYTLKWNDRFIHANRKYVAYHNTDTLYVVDTKGFTNWSHNVKYKSYIFRFVNGDFPVFAYGEFVKTNQNDDGDYIYSTTLIRHPLYLYNMDTNESNYVGLAQDVLCFSPNNKYLFYNSYIGIAYEYYWWNGKRFLTNCGPLSVYHLKEKRIQTIGNHWIETNTISSQYGDQIIGLSSDFSKFYLLEVTLRYENDRWTNENGQTVTNIDGVWEIDISSLGLKDE